MGLHNQVMSALATNAAAIAGVKGASATATDEFTMTPYAVVGPSKGSFLNSGSWERILVSVPLRLYVLRVSSPDRDQVIVNDTLDLFLTGWRSGITLGGLVTEAIIRSWDTDRFYEVNGARYQAIDFVVSVEIERSATYTA